MILDNVKVAEGPNGYDLVSSKSADNSVNSNVKNYSEKTNSETKTKTRTKNLAESTSSSKPSQTSTATSSPSSSSNTPPRQTGLSTNGGSFKDTPTINRGEKTAIPFDGENDNFNNYPDIYSEMKETVSYDGIDDYRTLPGVGNFTKNITMKADFLSTDLDNCPNSTCRIISKATGTRDQEHDFMLSTMKQKGKTRLRMRMRINGKTHKLFASSGDIKENEWVNAAATYDGKVMRLFKDGKLVGSKNVVGDITSEKADIPVWVGGNPSGAKDRAWKGQIKNVQVYGK